MIKSIQHFEEESIRIFEKLEDVFFKNPTHIAEYICDITKELQAGKVPETGGVESGGSRK